MKLSIVIVNYQSQKYLKRCLDSIELYLTPKLKNRGKNLEVIIVNNDQSRLTATANYSFFTRNIDAEHNLGFGAACNLGAQDSIADYLLFLNPDTQLLDGSLQKMFDFATIKKGVGIVGPRIIDSTRNAPQPWTSGNKTTLLNILFRNTFGAAWNKKQPSRVDWVSGTALLIRRDLFSTLGGFDENFFMYFEDQDLCLRAKKRKYQVFFYPLATILHHNGKSWEDKKLQKQEYYRSQAYFFQKHGKGWEKWMLGLLKKVTGK